MILHLAQTELNKLIPRNSQSIVLRPNTTPSFCLNYPVYITAESQNPNLNSNLTKRPVLWYTATTCHNHYHVYILNEWMNEWHAAHLNSFDWRLKVIPSVCYSSIMLFLPPLTIQCDNNSSNNKKEITTQRCSVEKLKRQHTHLHHKPKYMKSLSRSSYGRIYCRLKLVSINSNKSTSPPRKVRHKYKNIY